MGTPDTKLSDLVDIVRSWIPRRTEPVNLSRDFWMPDQSCLVCYECDSPFTIFNRRHHCRLCGRVFCGNCTGNSIPANSDEQNDAREDRERIRVCNYCFKQWEQAIAGDHNGAATEPTPGLNHSPSAASLVSSKSSCTCSSSSSTSASTPYSTGPYQHVPYSDRFVEMDQSEVEQGDVGSSRTIQQCADIEDGSSNNYFSLNRSDDESDEYGMYHLQYGPVSMRDVDNMYLPYGSHPGEDNTDAREEPYSSFPTNVTDSTKGTDEEVGEPLAPSIVSEATSHEDAEPVDFENNGLLWLPPEPADKEDEREALMLDEDDGEGASGEWGYLRSTNSFGSDYRYKDKSGEEHRQAMKNVLESHFRVLIAQLLQVENLPASNEEGKDNWLDIITCLSWEAATLLKPDMSKGGGMDPGGYVKVKCIACGRPSESKVVKGVVCKKNVAHRRMTSKIEKPRFLILGGALEYQRVSNHLSSVDTLLQQEMDHLKMAVAKIDAHHPNILLVEKSVSRYAQDYILAKDISLVLNIKRPLLERIARCTGAQIIPSVDHLTSPKLGYCDGFRVEKFFEEHGSAGQGGKKLTKTLMFFEGCPKPFGCTVLLKGASGDDLKKVKHVVQYGVFAAYHLALETSFLADEGASLPELPLKSPITVALPDKATSIERSISTVSGFPLTPGPKPLESQPECEVNSANKSLTSNGPMSAKLPHSPSCLTDGHFDQNVYDKSALTISVSQLKSFGNIFGVQDNIEGTFQDMTTNLVSDSVNSPDTMNKNHGQVIYEMAAAKKDEFSINPEMGSAKEEFTPSPSPSDHQSILVSLSTRCVWKGTVCERAHLFRIKYYGSFDKPLGRFLRDHLLDQSYRCNSCELPSEAHVHCYTHRQGSLTISVRKLQDINLPGERDGKIWMWHRCLKCPRKNGFPQATQRVVMSDAAWGLSFGKFLELSFSNHAAASRVANCGHSLHRDCLRFYGFGRMVACFRYASINVLSVYLPPAKLDFTCSTQEWIEKEVNEMRDRAKLLFTEVSAALNRIRDKLHSAGQIVDNPKASNVGSLLEESEILLLKDKQEIEESLGKVLSGHGRAIDILEINKLRKQIIHLSYTWDQHLISTGKMVREVISSSTKSSEKPAEAKPSPAKGLASSDSLLKSSEKPAEAKPSPAKGLASSDSLLMLEKPDPTLSQTPPRNGSIKTRDADQETNHPDVDREYLSASENIGRSDSLGSEKVVRKVLSEGEFRVVNLSDTLDAAWIGESQSQPSEDKSTLDSSLNSPEPVPSPSKGFSNSNSFKALVPSISRSFNLPSSPKPNLVEYSPLYVQSFWESERHSGAKLLLPSNDTVIPVYEDEPTSIISFALVSNEYLFQSLNGEKPKDGLSSTTSLPVFDSVSLLSFSSLDDSSWDPTKSLTSTATDESLLRSPQNPDPLSSTRDLHIRVSFMDENPQGKVKYGVVCYYGKQFEALRRICCPSEMDYVRSLSRCKKWGAQGGKSNVFFAKTLDDRFIIKQVTKTELESFIKVAHAYFKYLSESIGSGSPTCLAKILGIYQVSSKHLKGGKETKMDVLVMENLLFQRNITRLYDLKGSARSRYNPDTSGSNKVLLDQNLIEAMPTSPIFVGNKAKRLLERAVWNDTAFLASIDVMDYSLLVGVDEERHELVLGIIDFIRQYTWDKHLETWVKTSAILGGSKTESPTVISPQMYKKRFRKAMTAYFLMVPDQWSPPTIIPSRSQTDLNEEAGQTAAAD